MRADARHLRHHDDGGSGAGHVNDFADAVNQRVLATVGMTYFTSALDRADVVQRYVPLVKALAGNIAASVSSLQQ